MAKTMEADEIEVTPEMIEAGERCYRSIDGRFADLEFILTSVFRAMAEASSGLPPMRGGGSRGAMR